MSVLTPIQKFLQDQICLLVEPSQSFISTMQNTLSSMGLPPGQILATRRYEQAVQMIEEKKPKMIVCEYQLENHFGLALIERLEKFYDDNSRIAIVVTNNSSDSVVAEAAEEQVDAFLLKPLSPDIFRQRVDSLLLLKSSPSPYAEKIKNGKTYLVWKEFDKAAKEFNDAKALSQSPSLACFYSGQTEALKASSEAALKEFRMGRHFQPLHYKCLIGEFETLMEAKRHHEAYRLVEAITKNFPLTPRRLKDIFVAAVFTRNFADIGGYFALYERVENKSPELSNVASMGLFTAGRHFLEQKMNLQAMDLFDKAATVAAREFGLIERIIGECLKAGAVKDARLFLGKVRDKAVGTPAYNRLAFQIDLLSLGRDQLIEKGRKLIQDGEADGPICQAVVKLLVDDGKLTLAETIIIKCVAQFPELRSALYKILEDKKTGN